MAGSRGGAIQPAAAASRSMVTCAPSSVVMAPMRASVAASRVDVGRESERELECRRRAQHVPAVLWLGQPVGSRDFQRGAPGARHQAVDGVGREKVQPVDDRRGAVGELGRQRGDVGPVCVGDPRSEQFRQEDAAIRLVLDLRQHPAQNAEGRRHHAAALSAVDALGQHVDLHRGDEVAAQRRRQPEAVVAEATRIEADHEARRPDALLEVLEVRGEVGAAALLARLNEDEHAALAAARCHQTRHGGERRVAVVGRPPAVEEVALAHRFPRPEPAAPLAERRLLVHVAVDQDRFAAAAVVDQQQRRAAWQRDDLDGECRFGVLDPSRQQLGRRRDGATLLPVRVEGGGETRYAGVLAQRRKDPFLPGGVDVDGGAGHDSVISANRSSDLDMEAAVCWPILGFFKKKACLSWLRSQDSVTFVPPSTVSSS